MLNYLQYVNFSRNPFIVSHIYNFIFLKDFDGDFALRDNMGTNFDFSKCTFTNSFAEYILSNFSFMGFQF